MITEKDKDKAWELRLKVENHIEECELIDALYEMAEWKNEQYKWHKVADGDLPNKSDGKQTYLCQIANNNGILKDPLLRCYYCGEFVNHITLAPMAYDDNVIAWMEIPEYEAK